ncbi:hypothetical protein [uncultured Maribacter sp.]|uniref:hypothetical protein n=1 Tax=uncultured Maribacter sp. TaxID=431308 RepID=UPI00260788DA|nr:hypothetical protein [uncultured Maribacter sp.]
MKVVTSIILILTFKVLMAQVPTAGNLVTIHSATLAEINTIANPYEGSLIYNTDDKTLYQYNGSIWKKLQPNEGETKIIADDNIIISGTGTDADPYKISSIPAKFTQNTDGSYTFSNGLDPDITFSGMPLNYPIVSVNSGNLGNCSQFAINETKNIIITGNYFDGSAKVVIPGQTVNNVTLNSATQITANVTSGGTGGTYDIQVTTSTGTGTLPNGFKVATSATTYNLGTLDIFRTGAMAYNSGVLHKTSGVGWNAQGYSSYHAIPAGEEGKLNFTAVTNNRYRMAGLNSDPTTNASYQSLDYAIYVAANTYIYVYENGSNKGNFSTYSPGDNFEIQVDCSGRVSYYRNGSEFYSSTILASEALYFDSSFYQSNSGISNISITY